MRRGYYFTQLFVAHKNIYDALLFGLVSCTEKIILPPCNIVDASLVFEYVLLDNPMIFGVASFELKELNCESIFYPKYMFSRCIMEKNTCAVAEYLRVFDCIKTFSELDKELYVHDYCLNHFRYDYDFGKYAYSVLGAVLCQSAACEGIAKFVKLALDSVGVKNLVVKGEAKDPTRDKHEPHAWNIVKIANETFHLDVTFDMTLKDKFNRYDYFNLSDKDISADHVTTMAVPACVAQGKDYFAMRGMTARTPIELRSYVKTCISRGDKNIHVKLYDMRSSENIAEKVAGLVLREYGKNVSVNVRYNPLQCVFEIDVHSL